MKWLRRILLVVGWGLVALSGWLKGGNDAGQAVLLTLLIGGVVILVGRAAIGTQERDGAQ